jgi:predicted type IV restriction endonuclease
MVLLLARCWLYKLLQQQVLPTHQRASFYADWYKTGRYNETQLRREFIDPFFTALGWDVDNTAK